MNWSVTTKGLVLLHGMSTEVEKQRLVLQQVLFVQMDIWLCALIAKLVWQVVWLGISLLVKTQ